MSIYTPSPSTNHTQMRIALLENGLDSKGQCRSYEAKHKTPNTKIHPFARSPL